MYGAILGDMIGAPYEFDRGGKTKEFPLFSEHSRFTDDTVMTVAVADALLGLSEEETSSEQTVRMALTSSMRRWGRKYPGAGYGQLFARWLLSPVPRPYGSYGNGSAMRVSAAGWLYPTLEKTRAMARITASVTHNHPEGIRGAEAVASAIFLARTGSSKEEIRDYTVREFGYDLSRTCDQIRPGFRHVETCRGTVPEAVTAFLEGEDFEDVIRTAVSLGGDSDTVACIAGSIAEAFYGVPALLEAECKARLPEEMRKVLDRFDEARGRTHGYHNHLLDGNTVIERAIEAFSANRTKETLIAVLESIRSRMHENGQFMIPVIPPQVALDALDIAHTPVGGTVTLGEDLHFRLQHIRTNDGRMWLTAFTSDAEYRKGEPSSVISNFIDGYLKGCRNMSEAGILINPWGNSFMLTKEMIAMILEADKPENHIYFAVGDIAQVKADAIVNASNSALEDHGGISGAILRAGGKGLRDECRALGGCKVGEAKITGGWALPAKYVIHTVGPHYTPGDPQCPRLLRACYQNSLELAKQHDLHIVAFPAIATGARGYPKEEAALVALTAVSSWLSANPDYGMAVILVCRNEQMRKTYQTVIEACAPKKD